MTKPRDRSLKDKISWIRFRGNYFHHFIERPFEKFLCRVFGHPKNKLQKSFGWSGVYQWCTRCGVTTKWLLRSCSFNKDSDRENGPICIRGHRGCRTDHSVEEKE